MSVRCERRATAHYFMELNQLCLPGLLETLTRTPAKESAAGEDEA